MDNNYKVSFDKNGKINWISITKGNEVIVKKIQNTDDNAKYMEQLKTIAQENPDFFAKYAQGEYQRVSAKSLEKKRQKIATSNYKQEKRQKPKDKKQSSFSLRTKAAALLISGVMGVSALVGCGLNKKNTNAETKAPVNIELIQDEDSQALKSIYEQLLQYENGEAYVKYLMEIDKKQAKWNNRLAQFPDANGNILQLKAEEWAAEHAVANATNPDVPVLLDADTVLCLYLIWSQYATEAVMVTNELNGVEKTIVNQDVKTAYTNVAEKAQKLLNGEKIDSKESITKLYQAYPEAPSLLGYDGTLTMLAQSAHITPEDLEKYQEGVKGNAVLNKVIEMIKAKQETEKNQKEIMKLCQKAFIEMDKQNIKTDLFAREDFDISTSPLFEQIFGKPGSLVDNGNGTYTKIVKTKKGKTKRVTMTKEQAIKSEGKDAVDKAIDKADATDKIVDTDKDGKADSTLDEAEEISKKEQQEVENTAAKVAAARAKGESDGKSGKSNSNPYASGTMEYDAYNRGWTSGHNEYLAGKEERELIETKVEVGEQKTTSNDTSTRQKVTNITTYNETQTLETEENTQVPTLVRQ